MIRGNPWKLELDCRKVQDRVNHVIHTENPGHEADHQELGLGMERITTQVYIFFTGLHLLPFSGLTRIVVYYESIK